MLKLFRNAVVLGVVLTAGAGCSKGKDEVTKDVNNAPEPVIIGAQTNLEMSFGAAHTSPIDINDVMDFSESAPTAVSVESTCTVNKMSFEKVNKVEAPYKRTLISLMPKEIWGLVLTGANTITCSFDIRLVNSKGSTKVFFFPNAIISENSEDQVVLQKDQERINLDGSTFSFSDSNNILIRYNNQQAAAVEAICEDISLEPIPFDNHVVNFSKFDTTAPKIREGHDQAQIDVKPTQMCRLVLVENSNVVALSPRFNIKLPQPMLNNDGSEYQYRDGFSGFSPLSEAFHNLKPIQFSKFWFSNPSNFMRKFRILKANLPAEAYTYWQEGPDRNIPVQALKYDAPFINLVPIQVAGNLEVGIESDQTAWYINVPPHKIFHVEVQFTPPYPMVLPNAGKFLGYALETSAKGQVDELGDENKIISTVTFDLGQRIVGAKFGEHPQDHLVVLPIYPVGPWK